MDGGCDVSMDTTGIEESRQMAMGARRVQANWPCCSVAVPRVQRKKVKCKSAAIHTSHPPGYLPSCTRI